jgi:predicted kinase
MHRFLAVIGRRESVVADNTNLTPSHRARYFPVAKADGCQSFGVQFDVTVAEALRRNTTREQKVTGGRAEGDSEKVGALQPRGRT